MFLQWLVLVCVWCVFSPASASTARSTSNQPRYPAFPMQFTANYSDNIGATAQVFVASTRSATGRFLARIKYDMVLKQVELQAVYSHAYVYTAPEDAVKTARVYNRTLSLAYVKGPGQQGCDYSVGRLPEPFSPMGTAALMLGHSNGECIGLTVCDGMTYNGTAVRNGVKTDVWTKDLGPDDSVIVYVDASTGIPYESAWDHIGHGTFNPSTHTVAHIAITPGMPKYPIQVPENWEYDCNDVDRGVNSSIDTRGGIFVTTPKDNDVATFSLYDTPLRGNTTITFTLHSTPFVNCSDCIELVPNRLVFTPENYTQNQEVKLVYKKEGTVSVDMKVSGGYYNVYSSGAFTVCACAGGITGVTCHAPPFHLCS